VAQFDNLVVTVPADIDGEPIMPQELILADSITMIRDLKRRRLIAADGEMTLNATESFADYSFSGVRTFRLASEFAFTNLALAVTIFPNSVTDGAGGCGLFLRGTDETHYVLAYVNLVGEYGLAQREGDLFHPGIYGQRTEWGGEEPRHLLIIADESKLHYYIEGQYVGSLENPPVAGGIGNAVVNFEPMSTTCRFANLWLYRWDAAQ
jgi:hypothetical protein